MSLQANAQPDPAPGIEQRIAALRARQLGPRRHAQPVALIGPGDAGPRECDAAYLIAAGLARAGMSVVCGGRGGVMQAAAQGASEAGGLAIGLLPEEDCRAANPYLTVALPTGIGEMRNALVARSACCLVAVGSNLGTLSEMAMGLKWGKPLFTLYVEDMPLPGARAFGGAAQLLEAVVEQLLAAS